MQQTYPPGPSAEQKRLVDLHVRKDFFHFLQTMHNKFGDYVRVPLDDSHLYIVSRSELVKEVFQNDLIHYKKPSFILSFGLRYGEVKLTDEVWQERSRVVRPAFLPHRIMKSADTIISCTREMIGKWSPGEVINVNQQMRDLRVRIAARTIFDAELKGFGDPAQLDQRSGQIPYEEAMGEDFVVFPEDGGPPFASMVRRRLVPESSELVAIAKACFEAQEDRGDIMSFLMQATYDDGTPMPFEEVAEELILLFFSAHYTIPLVMTNLWYQLAQNPEIETKMREELSRELDGRSFTAEHLDALKYGNMLVKETLRMFPPAPILYRELIERAELGGARLEVGDYVLVYSHLLHFDERYFERPRDFWPERFDPARGVPPKHAYLPFGAGPRVCMGQALSMLEMRIVVAAIAEALRLEPVNGQTLAPKPHLVDGSEQPTYMRVMPIDSVR